MRPPEKRLAHEVKAMTRQEVIQKALEGAITWSQAATICGVSTRHLRRMRARYAGEGVDGLRDRRAGRTMPARVSQADVEKLCELREEKYMDFSIRHFHEFITERHGIAIGYTWTKNILQSRGLAEKAPGRGKHHRKRERRPMRGMLLHLDGSTHEWIPGLPKWDLIVLMDDADGRILYARFVEEEGTVSTLESLAHVLIRWGRFCELYTDRGSHFCTTTKAEEGPDDEQGTQVARVLKALGIRHILGRSPQARGRSERAFGTIQGRLPQELRAAGISDYDAANRYLDSHFTADFNRRFTVEPAQPESAFVPLVGVDLELLLSVQHERVVQNDNTVQFKRRSLQLESSKDRMHYVRCPVLVHELLDGTLGVSYQGKLIGRFTTDGMPIRRRSTKRKTA